MKLIYEIEEISNRLSIYDLYARYVHYADSADSEGLNSIFEQDAQFDYSTENLGIIPWKVIRDSDIFRGKAFSKVLHLCGNLLIKFSDDGFSANVSSKTISPLSVVKEGSETSIK